MRRDLGTNEAPVEPSANSRSPHLGQSANRELNKHWTVSGHEYDPCAGTRSSRASQMTETDWLQIGQAAGAFCLIAGGWLLVILRVWPRLFLRRFPANLRAVVEPLSKRERLLGLLIGLPLLAMLIGFPAWAAAGVDQRHDGNASLPDLFLAAFSTWTAFNLFDWLILDELLIGLCRPRWLVLKGTEHIPITFNHREHAVAFLKGTVGGAAIAAVVAGILYSMPS